MRKNIKDYYNILGISREATIEEINKAYRKKAKEHHPDRNPGDKEAINRFKDVKEAFDCLSDSFKKSQYDRGEQTYQPRRKSKKNTTTTTSSSYSSEQTKHEDDVDSGFFGGSTFKGRNITVRIEIDLKDSLTGCVRILNIKKRKRCNRCYGSGISNPCDLCFGSGSIKWQDPDFPLIKCPRCKGTGKDNPYIVQCGDCLGKGFLPEFQESQVEVNVSPGIDNGMQIRVVGAGEESIRGGKFGDLIVFIFVKEHNIFKREKENLILEVPVSYTQLVLGDEIDIPSLSEEMLKVKIPVGSATHTKFIIKGKGMPFKGKFGDLIATLKVEIPKVLSEDYKKLLEELSKIEKNNVTPQRERWNQKVNQNERQ